MRVPDALRSALPGHYAVERELGRGGMATVYLARDHRYDRSVVIKVVERDVLAPAGVPRFLREIRTAAQLTHPHVLSVFESGEAEGLLYYVMPYVDGETLRARLVRDGALPLADAVTLLRELAGALAYAHSRGVVHRDLKPENVLLSGGHAVIADFGIAKAMASATEGDRAGRGDTTEALTAIGVSLGTPAYMAPEQIVGDAALDHRADLYALGVVAYEMLAGAHPFGTRAPQAMVGAHLTEVPVTLGERRPDVPPALTSLVMQLLSKDPARRPQRAEEVRNVLADLPLGASRKPSRSAAVATMAGLLLVAAAGGYAAWSASTSPASEPASDALAITTIAVLPFVNTSGVETDDYFSDGMTDELAHALSRIPGVRLAGRTSSYTFKGKTIVAQEIGRALEVDAFIDGTVRRAGEQLRVSAQLVGTSDGKVLWDSVFETRSSDVFGVQDQFTSAIVAAIAPALGGSRGSPAELVARGTNDLEAYELYLKGRYHWLERGAANVAQSIVYLRQAVARDPEFARAHAALSNAYGILSVYFADPTDSATALTEASALRALALDSTLADAHAALGGVLERQMRFAEAEEKYRRALALEPFNPNVRLWFGFSLYSSGRTSQALDELGRAVQLDPLNKSGASALAGALVAARQFPEAQTVANGVLARDSTFVLGMLSMGMALAFGGDPDSAARLLERATRLYPDAPTLHSVLIFAYAAAGRWRDAERLRGELRRRAGEYAGGVDAAFAELVFGNAAPVITFLASEAGRRAWHEYMGFGCNPMNDPLWSEARFLDAMRDLGVAPCPLARPWPISRP